MFYKPKKVFAGHINVYGGPPVSRGPDVTHTWHKWLVKLKLSCRKFTELETARKHVDQIDP